VIGHAADIEDRDHDRRPVRGCAAEVPQSDPSAGARVMRDGMDARDGGRLEGIG
jgi:hypothetical protein